MSKQKKVGILGGTFNPPHIGHLIIANEVMHALKLDEIRFLPNHIPPHKIIGQAISVEDRENMLKLSLEGNPTFKIERAELNREGTSYTFDTVNELIKNEPANEFYFIIGGDMIEFLPHWYKIEELTTMIQFVGVSRPMYSNSSKFPVIMIESPLIEISSSLIREKVGNNQSIRYLVPGKVEQYIKEKKLYGSH
jgi:nicotinate-nucleotide adenylyltransferase